MASQYNTDDKVAFVDAVTAFGKEMGHVRQLKRALEDLSELCRRSRRIRNDVQGALS